MTRFAHAPVLQHPERIHPLLWRGSQLARPVHKRWPPVTPSLTPNCQAVAGLLVRLLKLCRRNPVLAKSSS